jgi:hypothetical protein
MDVDEDYNFCPICYLLFDETVNDVTITCLGPKHHKFHLECINQTVATQNPTFEGYARCLICENGYDIPNNLRDKVNPSVISIMDEQKVFLQGNLEDVKDAEKEKDYNKALWLTLREKKYSRDHTRWKKYGWAEIMKVFNELYDKYYDSYHNVLKDWIRLHRNYDPDKIKAKQERKRWLSELKGVDDALIDSTNKINVIIFYINNLAFNRSENKYIQPEEKPYRYYDVPVDYFEIEHFLQPNIEVTDELLERIIFFLAKKGEKVQEKEEIEKATAEGRRPIPNINRPTNVYKDIRHNNPNVFDDNYNRRPPPSDGSSGGSKRRNKTRKLKKIRNKTRKLKKIRNKTRKKKNTRQPSR